MFVLEVTLAVSACGKFVRKLVLNFLMLRTVAIIFICAFKLWRN